METLPQGINTASYLSLSEFSQIRVSRDVGRTLDIKHKDRMLAGFFRGLDDYVVHARYVDFIVYHGLIKDPEFQQSLKNKLTTILQSPAILSDSGWNLQSFLLILATYEEDVFKKTKLPDATVEVLRSRVEFLRANGQSGSIVDKLAQFLPKH